MSGGKYSIGLGRAFRCSGHNWLFRIGSSSHSLCCEPVSEERSAGNPHATFCGSRTADRSESDGQTTGPYR